ncbi:thioredoxin family protein [Enterococcus sp. LJL51]|uniref:thioredoxin family protein n=1 Tax=Enterococcus sp. LJL51 TaxID=3416656 RepID=UPI003CEE0D26
MKHISKRILSLALLLLLLTVLIYRNITLETSAAAFEKMEITELNEKIAKAEPLLVYYYAEDCLPCQVFSPELKEVTTELGITINQVDAKNLENMDFIKKYNLTATPTILLFKDGEVIRQEGAVEKKELKQLLTDWLL